LSTYAVDGSKIDEITRDAKKPRIHLLQPENSIEKIINKKYELTGPPEAFTATYGKPYRILFNAQDCDSNATISIYLDTDQAGEDGILIGSVLEDEFSYFDWNVPLDFAPGKYYIYAVISDTENKHTDYSHFAIQVN
jgi:hypothetical protein